MIKAAIFDVDGTLVDSVDQHARSWQDTFGEFGHTVTFDAVRQQIGKGGDELMPVFLSPDEIDRIGEKVEARRGEILKERYMASIKAFPDVRALFERLKRDGVEIVLASSAKEAELETYKSMASIGDLLTAQTSSDDVGKSKPHPDIFQVALRKVEGIAPDDIIVIGDTPYDAEAAGKAGLRTLGVLCGGWSEDDLRRAGCVAVFADPRDLLARYDESPFHR